MKSLVSILFLLLISLGLNAQIEAPKWNFSRVSSEYGDIEVPNKGKKQIATLVADFNKDGKDEFVIFENTERFCVVMFRHIEGEDFERSIIERRAFPIAMSTAIDDVDGDGDLDIIAGGINTNQIWWWENPYPEYDLNRPWRRSTVKRSGAQNHGSMGFGDFNGDGKTEIAFWNHEVHQLLIAEKPENVSRAREWVISDTVYEYNENEQMMQNTLGTELQYVDVNFHNGLSVADIDLDGVDDIVAGGKWFKNVSGDYVTHSIDEAFVSASVDVAQVIAGGRPEIVMAAANGKGPMALYEFKGGVWDRKILRDEVRLCKSLKIVDFDNDGKLDIIGAEMRTNNIKNSKTFVLYNFGEKKFKPIYVQSGIGSHDTAIGDFDGDGDVDILCKPYEWDTPRIELFLNLGPKEKK